MSFRPTSVQYSVSPDGKELNKDAEPYMISMWRIDPKVLHSFVCALQMAAFKWRGPPRFSLNPGAIITDDDCEIAVHSPDFLGFMFSMNPGDGLYSYLSVDKVLKEGATVVVYCHRSDDNVTVWYIERETGRLLQPVHTFTHPRDAPLQVSVCMRAVGSRMIIVPRADEDCALQRVNVWRQQQQQQQPQQQL